MTTPENLPNKKVKKWQIILGIIVALFIIGSLSGGNSSTSNSDNSSQQSNTSVDIMTKKSCKDWYVVISEGSKGVQTDAEIREGIKKVYDVAKYSEDLDISDAATRQLAAITAGDTAAFEIAATDFGNACKAHGQ